MATTLPRNADVADQFDLLADLLEIEGADSFRVVAYRRAATVMRETPAGIAQMALDGKAKSLTGIGKTIEEKIVQIVEEGEIQALRERKERIPAGVDLVHAASRPRPQDREADLAGARHLDASRS